MESDTAHDFLRTRTDLDSLFGDARRIDQSATHLSGGRSLLAGDPHLPGGRSLLAGDPHLLGGRSLLAGDSGRDSGRGQSVKCKIAL